MFFKSKELSLNIIEPSPIKKSSVSSKLTKWFWIFNFSKATSIISCTLYKITFFSKLIDIFLVIISFKVISVWFELSVYENSVSDLLNDFLIFSASFSGILNTLAISFVILKPPIGTVWINFSLFFYN